MTRLLLVDDDEDIRFLLSCVLGDEPDFEVAEASTGAEALDMLESADPFDLVILDVMLPKMSGAEVLAAMRQRPALRDIPVVFVTGNSDPETVARLKAAGALDVIGKPPDLERLPARMRAILTIQSPGTEVLA